MRRRHLPLLRRLSSLCALAQELGDHLLASASTTDVSDDTWREILALLVDVLFLPNSRPVHRQLLALLVRLPQDLLSQADSLLAQKVRGTATPESLPSTPASCPASLVKPLFTFVLLQGAAQAAVLEDALQMAAAEPSQKRSSRNLSTAILSLLEWSALHQTVWCAPSLLAFGCKWLDSSASVNLLLNPTS